VKIRNIAFAVALVVGPATSAQAVVNLIKNGSFETVDPALSFNANGVIHVTGSNTTALPFWAVIASNQYKINEFYDAQAGRNSVDLSGTAGSLYQDVTGLTIGTTYKVSFSLSGNPLATVDPTVELRLAGVASPFGTFSFDSPAGQTAANMGWVRRAANFVATSTSHRLLIRNTLTGADRDRGPVIDNVWLTVLPEPGTWLMMVAGFGLVGHAVRRQRRAFAAPVRRLCPWPGGQSCSMRIKAGAGPDGYPLCRIVRSRFPQAPMIARYRCKL
jgi:hypothetical protein